MWCSLYCGVLIFVNFVDLSAVSTKILSFNYICNS